MTTTTEEEHEFDTLVDKARGAVHNGRHREQIGSAVDERWELYHAGFSLCSHKVRCTLSEIGDGYLSHEISVLPSGSKPPVNYQPHYMRLRLASEEGRAAKFATSFTGASGVRAEGFDPCVVPTLVDQSETRIIVDSRRICSYLASARAPTLLGGQRQGEVESLMDLVDNTPHVALLYGANPDGDRRPPPMQGMVSGIHEKKIDALRELKENVKGDPDLVAAYEAKISKETSAGEFVATPEKMREAIDTTRDVLNQFESALTDGARWSVGDLPTLADIFWGVSLFRLQWLGYQWFWEDERLPKTHAYTHRIFAHPSIRSGLIEWPTVPPSEHVSGV